jgi:hypothetical protein
MDELEERGRLNGGMETVRKRLLRVAVGGGCLFRMLL